DYFEEKCAFIGGARQSVGAFADYNSPACWTKAQESGTDNPYTNRDPTRLFPFRMISDTRIECRHADSQWKTSPCAPAGAHGERVEPGSPDSSGLDGFLSSEQQRGP